MLVRIASRRRFWRVPAVCVLGGDRKETKTKNIFTSVNISLFELVCFHEELFCVLYCVYKCHVLTCIGQETIKYLILSYLILKETAKMKCMHIMFTRKTYNSFFLYSKMMDCIFINKIFSFNQ